jgi:hypothetical protein
MSSLTFLEKRQLEELLEMGSGYVLDFSNRTFQEFFRDVVQVDIYSPRYEENGTSKANHLRTFWECEDDKKVGKVLNGLLEIWHHKNPGKPNLTYDSCQKIVERLFGQQDSKMPTKKDFLEKDFSGVSLKNLRIESTVVPILEGRLSEATRCVQGQNYLSAVILSGSVLEGALLGTAHTIPQLFNQAKASPRDKEGKVKRFTDWSLRELIDVACECRQLSVDVQKFSHALRDFRNYIHPYEQMASRFSPDHHTAKICLQVLNAAIADLSKER